MSLEPDRKAAERRSEARHLARAKVSLWPEGFANVTATGRLLDRSAGGFRAQHGLKELVPGQLVHFDCWDLEGRARVVWTIIAGDRVQSGFRIVSRARSAAASGKKAGARKKAG